MLQIRFHPEADQELTAAADWYEARQKSLGTTFLEELDHSLEVIAESPRLWPLWPGIKKSLAIRRCLLSRFPYAIAYEFGEDGAVVFAVAHLSRRPRYWQNRLKS